MMKTVSALLLIFTIHSTALKMNKKNKQTPNNDEITPPITDVDYLKQLLRPDEIGLDKLDEEVAASKAREDTLFSLHRALKNALASEFHDSGIPDPETWKILEIGSGVGATTRDIRDRFPGALVTGFDFNEHVVARAQQETKYNDENIKFTNALPNEKYDFVVCENMLQPENKKEALAQIDALLSYVEKDGNLFIAFKPDTDWEVLMQGLVKFVKRQRQDGIRSRVHFSRDPKNKPKHDDFFENVPEEIVREVKANGGELPADLVDELKAQGGTEMPADFFDKLKAAIKNKASTDQMKLDEAGLYTPWIMVRNGVSSQD